MTQRVCEELAFFFGIKWMWHTRCTNNSHKNLTYSRIPYFSVALPTTTPQLLPACQGRVKQWETFSLIFKLYSKHLPLLHNAKLNSATAGLQSTTNPTQSTPLHVCSSASEKQFAFFARPQRRREKLFNPCASCCQFHRVEDEEVVGTIKVPNRRHAIETVLSPILHQEDWLAMESITFYEYLMRRSGQIKLKSELDWA